MNLHRTAFCDAIADHGAVSGTLWADVMPLTELSAPALKARLRSAYLCSASSLPELRALPPRDQCRDNTWRDEKKKNCDSSLWAG